MPQPIFYFDKLTAWDKVTIVLYLLVSLGVLFYFDSSPSVGARHKVLFFYAFGTQIFLYVLNYKSLRNLTVYLFWMGIGMIHLFVYFLLNYDHPYHSFKGDPTISLRNTYILLLLFQVLRFISAKTQGLELVCPTKASRTDFFDERKVTFIDYLLSLLYFCAMFGLYMN